MREGAQRLSASRRTEDFSFIHTASGSSHNTPQMRRVFGQLNCSTCFVTSMSKYFVTTSCNAKLLLAMATFPVSRFATLRQRITYQELLVRVWSGPTKTYRSKRSTNLCRIVGRAGFAGFRFFLSFYAFVLRGNSAAGTASSFVIARSNVPNSSVFFGSYLSGTFIAVIPCILILP